MPCTLEIVCVGNELLIGKTLNTNAQWLAKNITTLGGAVERITVIGDDVEKISTVIREVFERKPDFIITTGGLGPTFDDKTLAGVAKAFSIKLKKNNKALEMVEKKYREKLESGLIKKFEMTSARVKMAKLPEGSEPIFNPVGTAPAVSLSRGKVTIICLPGVPAEMQAIFKSSVASLIKNKSPNIVYDERSLIVKKIVESELAPIIDNVMKVFPEVYIKSHPRGGEKTVTIELHFSTYDKSKEVVEKRLQESVNLITSFIEKLGGIIEK